MHAAPTGIAYDIERDDPNAISTGQMRPRLPVQWELVRQQLLSNFGLSALDLNKYEELSKEDMKKSYEMMQLCRLFENACNQAYMQGNIRGFMHLDNGQETIPALVADSIKKGDIKHSYYREHTHAIASGVSANKVMAELFAKVDGTCKGAGGSMHIYDPEHNFQGDWIAATVVCEISLGLYLSHLRVEFRPGGWALVSEQLPYAVGAARSILLDRELDPEGTKVQNPSTLGQKFIFENTSIGSCFYNI